MRYSEIACIDKAVFKPCGIELTQVETELESQEYFAHNFQLNGKNVKFRTAKITPKKLGQFVSVWKRNEKGVTVPFDISDNIDFYIIFTRQQDKLGLFIFSKAVLHGHKILSDSVGDGKRGIRVYSAWDLPVSKQAKKTQAWQTRYFLDLSAGKDADLKTMKALFIE